MVTQDHQNCLYLIGHFLLVIFNNNDLVLHHFRDITTFTVYVTLRSRLFLKSYWKLQVGM